MLSRSLRALLVGVCLVAVPAAADFKLDKSPAAADGVPAALKEVVEAQGVRVLKDTGEPYLEMWLHKALTGEAKPPGGDVLYTGIADGSLLGVWRFVAAGSDMRSQPIKPGFYTMRYALMPADGNHLGAAQFRDFVLLAPASADSNLAANLKFEEVVALSRKASGTGHPAVFPMVSPEGGGPSLVKDDHGSWILKTKIATKSGGSIPVAIIVFGKAE